MRIIRLPYILIIITVLTSLQVSGQIIKGEAIAGINLSQVDGDEAYGFHKIRPNVGVGVMIPFGKKGKWDVTIETLYSLKGAYQKPQYIDTLNSGEVLTGEYKLHLNYFQIPALVLFTDKELITVGAGFSWGRLVGVKEWEHGQRVDSTTLDNGPYNKNDFSILGDLRIRIWKALKLNLRYEYSLVKIRTREFTNRAGDSWTRNQYNNVITFRLIYVFNEQRSRENFLDAK